MHNQAFAANGLAFEDWDTMDDGSEELDDITTTTYRKID